MVKPVWRWYLLPVSPCENIIILTISPWETEIWAQTEGKVGCEKQNQTKITHLVYCSIWGQMNAENHKAWVYFWKQALVLPGVNIANISCAQVSSSLPTSYFHYISVGSGEWSPHNDSFLSQALAESLFCLHVLVLHHGAGLAHMHAQLTL